MHHHKVMTTMIADETPPLLDTDVTERPIEAANDNGPGSTDARILVVARAIGRLIAREQLIQQSAANDNGKDITQEDTE